LFDEQVVAHGFGGLCQSFELREKRRRRTGERTPQKFEPLETPLQFG